MAISEHLLAAEENRYFELEGGATLRRALELMLESREIESWYFAVGRRADGTFFAVRFEVLAERAQRDRDLLSRPLAELDELPVAMVVEREELTTGQARREARRSPGRVVVVLEGGRFVGLVSSGFSRGAGTSDEEVRQTLDAERVSEVPEREFRYTDIGCPERVSLATERFQVVVRLTLTRADSSRAQRGFEFKPERPVVVALDAPGFEVPGAVRQEIWLTTGEDSPPVVFDLVPLRLGKFSLSVSFYQDDNYLGEAPFYVEVVANVVSEKIQSVRGAALDIGADADPPARLLQIGWDRSRREMRLKLGGRATNGWRDFQPIVFDEYILRQSRELYKDLDEARHGGEEAEERLRVIGQNLWRLLPGEFRDLYLQEHKAWEGESLLIVSDEPYLPWELLWPYGNGIEEAEEEPWCLSLKVSRWLRCNELREGNQGPHGELPFAALAYVAADQNDLPAVQREWEILAEVVREHRLVAIRPEKTTLKALRKFLGDGTWDWFHLAAHGAKVHSEIISRSLSAHPEIGKKFTPDDIVGSAIEKHLGERRPAFLFNACHAGRLGWDLEGLAGWAPRLLGCGASMFLAPLWQVPDEVALEFVESLYGNLLSGEGLPLAEAVRRARLEIRKKKPGDPTWLAYSLYGHPNAKVKLTPRASKAQA